MSLIARLLRLRPVPDCGRSSCTKLTRTACLRLPSVNAERSICVGRSCFVHLGLQLPLATVGVAGALAG